MKNFADLYTNLDETNSTNEKIAHLAAYFESCDPQNGAWAVYFLSGRRPRRAVSHSRMGEWAAAEAEIPDWLYRECYDAVGDSAETITLLLPDTGAPSEKPLHHWVEELLLPLRQMDDDDQQAAVLGAWRELNTRQRFVWNKLITGGFRVGVSERLVTRALAQMSGIDPAVIAHRLMGDWEPSAAFYESLFSEDTHDADISRPYPFFLAYPIDHDADPAAELDDPDVGNWQAEWKWDGIRAQVIKREGEVFIWSRGEELVTETYPEVAAMAALLPDGVALDGELLAWKQGDVLPFGRLQKRIGRKTVPNKLQENIPIIFMAYDLMERNRDDLRELPLRERRQHLEAVVASVESDALKLSPVLEATDWDDLAAQRENSRENKVEGLMLKRQASPYRVGRKKGGWWKWKIEPYTVDAVMIYAQRGSGKRASLYTDYTFAVWTDDDELVPFAKAYSGLTDDEIREVDNWVRNNYQEKFGPVRSVPAELVMEIAFEGIRRSNRHKSGVATRFPRILRWRRDLSPQDADRLSQIKELLPELPDDDSA